MKVQPIKTHLVVKQDPIVFRKSNKNIKTVSIVEKPKNKGLDLKG